MKPVIYATTTHGRGAHIAQALQQGFRRHGLSASIVTRWDGRPAGDVALAYGWAHQRVFEAYKAAGAHYAYWDLGYWNRHPSKSKGGHREGAYRLALDSWDTAHRMGLNCPHDRWEASGLVLQDPRQGSDGLVLVPGMSPKAAGTHGFAPDQWERNMMSTLGKLTDRQVLFRPKTARLVGLEPIQDVLKRTYLVVTHHSNVAVDAMLAGVSVHCVKGVGRRWSGDLSIGGTLARRLYNAGERLQFAADVAYAQWTPAEMRSGAAWDHIKRILACM